MNKTQFTIVAAILTVIMLMVAGGFFGLFAKKIDPPPPPLPTGGCSVCGRDLVAAHGSILLKNITQREVQIVVRHHPNTKKRVINLDPNGLEMVDGILVGTMKLQFIVDGVSEETFCTIAANTTHEMWWTVHGSEMHGTSMMHMGH